MEGSTPRGQHLLANQATVRKDLEERTTKILPNEGIDDGVEAAVRKGQELSDIQGLVDVTAALAGVLNQVGV